MKTQREKNEYQKKWYADHKDEINSKIRQKRPLIKDKINKCDELNNNTFSIGDTTLSQSVFSWMSSTEWQTLREHQRSNELQDEANKITWVGVMVAAMEASNNMKENMVKYPNSPLF